MAAWAPEESRARGALGGNRGKCSPAGGLWAGREAGLVASPREAGDGAPIEGSDFCGRIKPHSGRPGDPAPGPAPPAPNAELASTPDDAATTAPTALPGR